MLLAERIARNPHDAEARSELERLQQGLPLRATESAQARKRREEQEMRDELLAELAQYRNDPAQIESWEFSLLKKRRRRVSRLLSTLPPDLRNEASDYLRAMSGKLAQRNGISRRWRFIAIGLPLFAGACVLIVMGVQLWAQRAEESLRQAMKTRDIPSVEHALRLADSGLNRLANAELPDLIRQAETWCTRTARRRAELQEELVALETGESRISDIPLARRAELERTLHNLPDSMAELRQRWQRIYEQEERALAERKEEALQQFRIPLPPLPELSGIPEEDDSRLQRQQLLLQMLHKEWLAACELFQVDDALVQPLQTRLAELRQLREDIAALRRTVSLLPTARSYARYRQLLETHTPKLYPAALRMMTIRDSLPDEDKLRDQMQDHGRKLPEGMLEAARHALLEGGPSFPPAFPANVRQVQLMEDIFTYTGLQKALYEMSALTLPSVIVEQRPQPGEESVSFIPSPLTPGYSLDTPRRITWHNPQNIYIRRIDTTPILRETGINRQDFFSRSNLPTLLDALLRVEHDECPSLAKAFVFKRLLEVMAAHEWPTMFGIAYAPSLRADARSFSRLCRELGLPLEAGCWLQTSAPEVTRAEEACRQWFHERRHRHYAQEISRNFGALVQVHPRYVGFIGDEGREQLYRKLPEGTLLWYLAEGGLTATPLGEELESPVMYSPVFIVAKD